MLSSSWRPDSWLFGANTIDLGRLGTYNATTTNTYTYTYGTPFYSTEISEEDIAKMNIEE